MKTKELQNKKDNAFSKLIGSLDSSNQIDLLNKYLDIRHELEIKRIERMGKL